MSRARASNYANPTPPQPKPVASPEWLNTCAALDRSVFLAWEYTGADADTLTGFRLHVVGGDVNRDVFVPTPNTDVIVDGLVNGTRVSCWVYAVNTGGETMGHNRLDLTPAPPVIPAPTLVTLTPGDGLARATYSLPALPDGYTLRQVSFQATNAETGAVVDGKTTGTPDDAVLPGLDNETTWHVQLVAVADPGPVLSGLSNSLDVHPTQPIAPYPPEILDAYATEGGVLVVKWAPTDQPNGATGPLDITQWRVRVHSADGKGTDFEETFPGAARTWGERKLTMGYWEVFIQARNDVGWSMDSKPAVVFYSQNYSPPLTGGGTTWEDLTYYYLWCKSDANLTRTDKGKDWPITVAVIGAGGSGKRATLVGGKGGDGGGGELVITQLPAPGVSGPVVVKVAGGATENSGDNPPPSSVTEAGRAVEARSGQSTVTKENAEGFGPEAVPESWRDTQPFMWNKPLSYTVGGTTTEGTPDYPNGYGPGQGGAGVKNGHAGNGQDGLVVFRWRKDGKPEAPLARKRWWRR